MRYLLLCCLFLCVASTTVFAQTPMRSDAMQIVPVDTNAPINWNEPLLYEDNTTMYPIVQYNLQAWVATIKDHYAEVQAMAQGSEPMLPPSDRRNSEASLVTKTF